MSAATTTSSSSANSSVFSSNKDITKTTAKYIKKPLLTPSLNSSAMASSTSTQLPTSNSSNSLNMSQLTGSTSSAVHSNGTTSNNNNNNNNTVEKISITSLNTIIKNNSSSSLQSYQNGGGQQSSVSSYYANVSSTSAANSTGAASSILSTASSMSHFSTNNNNCNNNNNNNNSINGVSSLLSATNLDGKPEEKLKNFKMEQFELLTTVGTGTFGRVIVVRHKTAHDYYALKIMSIAEVLRLKQTEHVKNEKDILQQVKHPFIINLYWTSHNERFLYMLLDYVCGGELFSYLRNAVKFSSDTANFYAAEIICALEYLHSLSIIYRDLKPENLLLDKQGHIRICDFGFAKKVYDRTWTLCGTPEYLAPEIIQGKGHHKAVDWWALGILIYEMLAGYPPFYDDNPFQIYQKILAGKIEWPRYIDLVAKDLIRKLLVSDRTKRLGTMKNGPEDIKRHKWFRNADWDLVLQKKLPPPIIPKVSHDGDTINFDKYDEEGWKDVPVVSPKNLQPFEDF